MKKNLIILILIFPIYAMSQDLVALHNLYTEREIYQVDGDNIVVSRVVENINASKDEIYLRAKNYFVSTYSDSRKVIKIDDKEQGVIVGEGYYNTFWKCYRLMEDLIWSASHTIRVDVKDNRARIICSVKTIDLDTKYNDGDISSSSYYIVEKAPFTKKGIVYGKKKLTEAFAMLVREMLSSVNGMEECLKKGNLSIESEDW